MVLGRGLVILGTAHLRSQCIIAIYNQDAYTTYEIYEPQEVDPIVDHDPSLASRIASFGRRPRRRDSRDRHRGSTGLTWCEGMLEQGSKRWSHITAVCLAAVFICFTLISSTWYTYYIVESSMLRGLYGTVAGKASSSIKGVDNSGVKPVANSDRLIVVAHYRDDLKWTEYIKEANIPLKLVEKDNPLNDDNVGSNNFTEATSYLYYMIKYYDNFPKVIAFVHGHGDPVLLRDEVWSVDQYTALPHPETMESCNTRHEQERGLIVWLGLAETRALYNVTGPFSLGENDEPDQYMRAFHTLFAFLRNPWEEGGMGMNVPHYISTLCCSAFSIPGEAIRKVPKKKYQRLFDYLELGINRDMGVTMEYVWTVLFSEQAWR